MTNNLEFLEHARKNREWTQNDLKYFRRARKKSAEEGELPSLRYAIFTSQSDYFAVFMI